MSKTKLSKKDKAIEYGITQQKVIDRFNKKLSVKKSGCIEINTYAFDKRNRYRGFSINLPISKNQKERVTVKAHRFAYALQHGFDALPSGDITSSQSECINHICGNTKCVNTDHLNIMTIAENGKYRSPKYDIVTLNMVNGKTCVKCNTDKNYSEFYKRSKMADGHDYYCKECRNEYSKMNAYRGNTLCSFEDCTNIHYARNMCKNHYHRFLYNNKNKKTKEKKNG